MILLLGTIFKVALLLINAVAVLSEDRFLARLGWVSGQPQGANAGFTQTYDQAGYGAGVNQGDVGLKARLIDLISAVRTLMRIPLIGVNIIVIVYELLLG
ncbi:Protein transport protein YOS1 [Hypsizygus marmoreus]|uniref:Protein transport protein YOS1 n=1 Tax=Hypsizygus marmoreus TaxID=39966 RepID=A0A369JK95_HYPMA|nr:Protein transport protein YOS1 [Hypsizygus marmoreus]